MKVLVVAVLGSLRGGTAVRLALTVEALARLADVHLFVVTEEDQSGPVPGADHAVRVGTAHRRRPGLWAQALRWTTRPALPDHLARLDLDPAADALRAFAPPDRELTWLCKPDSWLLARTAGVLWPTTICDIDDLDDDGLRSMAALRTADVAPPPEFTGAAGSLRLLRARVDASRWRSFRETVAARAFTVVCSEFDRARSGLASAAVVPNGYPAPGAPSPAEPPAAAATTTAVFVGSFHYLPNLDAARWMAKAIAPELRRLDPSATLRLVGDGPPEMSRLARVDGVSWTGAVADTGPELRGASVALVPLRAGSGTRVKILEAWAHGVPVVSTPLGAEGLDAHDGEDLLLAAGAPALAAAVHALRDDDALRRRLVEAGTRRWLAHHSPDAVAEAVASVVRGALQSAGRP